MARRSASIFNGQSIRNWLPLHRPVVALGYHLHVPRGDSGSAAKAPFDRRTHVTLPVRSNVVEATRCSKATGLK